MIMDFTPAEVVAAMVRLQPSQRDAIVAMLRTRNGGLATFCRFLHSQSPTLFFDAVMMLRGLNQETLRQKRALHLENAIRCHAPTWAYVGCTESRAMSTPLHEHASSCSTEAVETETVEKEAVETEAVETDMTEAETTEMTEAETTEMTEAETTEIETTVETVETAALQKETVETEVETKTVETGTVETETPDCRTSIQHQNVRDAMRRTRTRDASRPVAARAGRAKAKRDDASSGLILLARSALGDLPAHRPHNSPCNSPNSSPKPQRRKKPRHAPSALAAPEHPVLARPVPT